MYRYPPWQTKLKIFFTDLGALALSRALVGLVARGMENECHRSYFHPDWSPTERAMFDSLFWGPILAVLQFPVFWSVANLVCRGRLQLPPLATGQTGSCHMFSLLCRIRFVRASRFGSRHALAVLVDGSVLNVYANSVNSFSGLPTPGGDQHRGLLHS